MKIALLGPTSEKYKGGIAQFTHSLSDHMQEEGHEVDFHSWSVMYPYFLTTRKFHDNKSKEQIGKSTVTYDMSYQNPLSWWKTAKSISDKSPQVIILTWIHPVHAPVYIFFIFLLRRLTKAKIILLCHNVLPHEMFPFAKILSKAVFSLCDRLIVHSSSEKDIAKKISPAKQITKLFLPLHDFFSKNGENRKKIDDKLNLLFFGNVRHYKGLDVLLKALPHVLKKNQNFMLNVHGEFFYKEGAEETNPRKLVEELGIQDYVNLDFRYIPNEEVGEIFTNADLGIFPYRSATQSGPITIAYSHSLPVVCTTVGGLKDVAIEGKTAYTCKSESPEDLARAILEFIDSPLKREDVKEFAQTLSWTNYISGALSE